MLKQWRSFLIFTLLLVIIIFSQTGVLAQERKFLDLNLQFLGEYELTQETYEDVKIGGLSGITYDAKNNVYYAISDDRSQFAPARFFSLKIDLDQQNNQAKIKNISVEKVTFLKNSNGENFPAKKIDTEGIALTPRGTLLISSEGVNNKKIAPFINEFDLNGNLINQIRIPSRYVYNEKEQKGIQDNLGFESLAIKANGIMPEDPFRVFTATELALTQDINPDKPQTKLNSRLLHYVINPIGEPVLIAEHLYQVDNGNIGVLYNGVTELFALPDEGYLLSLERTFGINGHGAKIFQIVMANASDISSQKSLAGNLDNLVPVQKKLLLNLKDLNIQLDNLEGMTFGSRLADGSQSLILVSDNNFNQSGKQKNQFLLFKIQSK